MKILNLCCYWNLPGATLYALTELDPNRSLIIWYTKQNSSNSESKMINQDYFAKIYNFFKEKFSCHVATTNAPEITIPPLEQELIKIYNQARQGPKDGFKAELFLEAFNSYLTYGPKQEFYLTNLMEYKEYDLAINFL